ncbi:unnamed protein product [Cyprideis torosa]|uniref:Uncharacterized protein n=1 Tax=Cyprideis torosa TaxID=163714 RepID=A0A7R8W667_9CRUS|nr:unnamed protein product [Cyprideis torosa]CAG0883706.1 unnamed protein product [Cyprideis torosa]
MSVGKHSHSLGTGTFCMPCLGLMLFNMFFIPFDPLPFVRSQFSDQLSPALPGPHAVMSSSIYSRGDEFHENAGSRNCINGVTHFLDGSYIYGSHEHKEKELIARTNGEMRMWYKFKYRKPLLPQTTKESHECLPLEEHHKCFNGGDVRANEQPTLLVLHTIGTRYHNSVAKALRAYNPHWDDQKTYEEARRIVVAVFQHIVYKEFLPIILGWETIHRYGLGLETAGYYYGYNPSENSNILIGFMTAAFRFGHTLLPDHLDLYNSYHNRIGSVKLVDQLNQPWLLMEEKNFDRFVLGMINQKTSKYDASVIDEVRGTLFKKPNETLGHDLVTLNIQRGRDHGLQSYTRYRDWCGLRPVHSWYDLHGLMPNHTISAFKSLYKYVDDIELFSAGISEFNLPNSVLGETFACIIARQFKALRDGDRFWYENAGQPSSFTPDQLYEIRQMSFARIMCDETDDVVTIQRNVFLQPDPFSNPRIPCANYIALPKLNFAPWKELPGDIPVASATGYYSPPPVVAYDLRHVIHP